MNGLVVIVLNGEPPAAQRLQELAEMYPVYAADGGAWACIEAGVRPEWVAGDLDSALREQIPKDWEIHEHPEQDRTDFQKVMADLPEGVRDVLILGGLGRRTDHQLTNLMIAAAFPEDLQVTFEQGEERITRITSACPYLAEGLNGETLSLLPFPGAERVTTTGLRWNLEGVPMEIGGQLGQSNEVTGPVRISITSGCLYLWMTISTVARRVPWW